MVEASLPAAQAAGVAGQTFNIACGERPSVVDIVRGLEVVLDRPLAVRYGPPRQGDVRDTLADISLAAAHLGCVPSVDFLDGLRRTVEAFRKEVVPGLPGPFGRPLV